MVRASRQDKEEGGCYSYETPIGGILEEVAHILLINDEEQVPTSLADPDTFDLPEGARDELCDFVARIADMHQRHAYHNFEHASHLTMSVAKILSRISSTENQDSQRAYNSTWCSSHSEQDPSYGLATDAVTQFACLFAALIRNVGHLGVPNEVLVKQNSFLVNQYNHHCITEQNALDQSWGLLQDKRFARLANTIYSNKKEMLRFRQIVVNCVIAMNSTDKSLMQSRKERWDREFQSSLIDNKTDSQPCKLSVEERNRKATLVLECMMQVCDSSHAMQHWFLYRKWNRRLYLEQTKAFRANGVVAENPATSWYTNCLSVFDHHILPLAQKLLDCRAFGKCGEEYLLCAQRNRREWDIKGKEIVADMMTEVERMCNKSSTT